MSPSNTVLSVPTRHPVSSTSAHAAIARAETLSRKEGHVGAIAFNRTGDPASGEFGDAVLLKEAFGEVPSDLVDCSVHRVVSTSPPTFSASSPPRRMRRSQRFRRPSCARPARRNRKDARKARHVARAVAPAEQLADRVDVLCHRIEVTHAGTLALQARATQHSLADERNFAIAATLTQAPCPSRCTAPARSSLCPPTCEGAAGATRRLGTMGMHRPSVSGRLLASETSASP
jgi:hypothetical protein